MRRRLSTAVNSCRQCEITVTLDPARDSSISSATAFSSSMCVTTYGIFHLSDGALEFIAAFKPTSLSRSLTRELSDKCISVDTSPFVRHPRTVDR